MSEATYLPFLQQTLRYFDRPHQAPARSAIASPAAWLRRDLEPGDIQLLSNHSVIHARTDYVDHPEADRKRHLLRLWITL